MDNVDTGTTGSQTTVLKSDAVSQLKKFGTFQGVFVPTLLTILGVIMYLRAGAVVGNAGLFGAWIIISIAFIITTSTALSMSSITTNIRIGAGGAYSIISQSLGLEVGGSIGIPFYLSQGLATAMYIFGFREGWLSIFPTHPAIVVDLLTFAVIFGIAFISTNLAFRIQYVIMAIIAVSLVCIFGTFYIGAAQYQPTFWGSYVGFPETGFRGTNFWFVFALFFPAATGIMAGANMSGELKSPRHAIPLGTLAAIAVAYVVYMALAYWFATVATPQELVENYNIALERSLWKPAIVAGLLGATFSSGLSSLVGAPRILQALSEHRIIFGKRYLAQKTAKGEPRNALMLTGVIVLLALFLRDLTAIAVLVTMFFLITYAMINIVVLIEQSLGLISFRPSLRIPQVVSLVGTIGCLFVMFIVNPAFSLVSLAIVFGIYIFLTKRNLSAPFGDVRSGLFISLAEWAARRMTQLSTSKARAWKPNLLIPVEDARDLRGTFRLIYDIAYPKGSIHLLGFAEDHINSSLKVDLPKVTESLREEDVFAYSTLIQKTDFGRNMLTSMSTMGAAFLNPNILFLSIPAPEDTKREEDLKMIIGRARENKLGVVLFGDHKQSGMGRKRRINIWVRDQSGNWDIIQGMSNIDLALLLSYQIERNWKGKINLLTAVNETENIVAAEKYLENLVVMSRLPDASVQAFGGSFAECIRQAPQADLNIFGLPDEIDFEFARQMVKETESTCIFVRDSGDENALA